MNTYRFKQLTIIKILGSNVNHMLIPRAKRYMHPDNVSDKKIHDTLNIVRPKV